MTIFFMIAIFFSTFIFWEIFTLGKYFAQKNLVFSNNIYAHFAFGTTIWFAINFISLVPLLFFNIEIIYFIIIFVVKEFITVIFLTGRKINQHETIKWKLMLKTYITIWVITVMHIYVTRPYIIGEENLLFGKFSTFEILISSLAYVSNVSHNLIYDWVLLPLGIGILFSIVNFFIVRISKKINEVDFIFTALLVYSISILFTTIFSLYQVIAFALIIWALILSINIVEKSRRRYTVFYSLAFLASWSITHYVFAAFIAIAILSTMIYTSTGGRKVYLFWLQMILPLSFVGALYLYDYSIILTTTVLVVLSIVYMYFVFSTSKKIHGALNMFLYKTRWTLPWTLFILFIILGSLSFVNVSENYIFIKNGLLWFQNDTSAIINMTAYMFLVSFVIIANAWIYFKKIRLIKSALLLRFLFWYIVFLYNPLFEAIIIWLNISENFLYPFSFVIWIPVTIMLFVWVKEYIISRNKKALQ